MHVLCEGCGPCVVNDKGERIDGSEEDGHAKL